MSLHLLVSPLVHLSLPHLPNTSTLIYFCNSSITLHKIVKKIIWIYFYCEWKKYIYCLHTNLLQYYDSLRVYLYFIVYFVLYYIRAKTVVLRSPHWLVLTIGRPRFEYSTRQRAVVCPWSLNVVYRQRFNKSKSLKNLFPQNTLQNLSVYNWNTIHKQLKGVTWSVCSYKHGKLQWHHNLNPG